MYMERLKSAAYINERIHTINTYDNDIKNQWIKIVKLPEEYKNSYYQVYNKNEKDFFCCLNEDYKYENKDWKWLNIIEDFLRHLELKYVEEISFSEELLNHPFFVFANIFALYVKDTEQFTNKAIFESAMEKIATIVLEKSTKILLEELYIYKEKCKSEDSAKCYKEYCDLLKDKDIVEELFYKYPLMFRIIIEESYKAIEFYKAVEVNFLNDYQEIQKRFNISGELQKVENNVGDSHRGKQQVLVFHFKEGKLLYKPRNLGVDEKFIKVIDYVNNAMRSDLKYAKVYNRDKYGWQEFIENIACESNEQVKKYYYKIGIFSAIFYILMASDMHMENIVCSLDSPVFIDLESLFQCYKGKELTGKDVYENIGEVLMESVLSTCLFPGNMNLSNGRDLSGITGCGGQIIPKGKYAFINKYTSDMRIIRQDYVTEDKKNIPVLNGIRINPRNYTDEIISGFEDMYDFIQNNKEVFVKQGGLIEEFFDCPVRTIMRNTANYSVLLKASTESKYMSNAAMRNQLFDRLWVITESKKEFRYIVPNEIEDLLLGDVPYFYTYINSSYLYNSKGEIINEYQITSMYLKVIQKIEAMDNYDKYNQIEFIKKSMAEPIKRWELKEVKKDYSNIIHNRKNIIYKKQILELCRQIFNEIEEMAYYEDKNKKNEIGWIDLRINSGGQWTFMPMDNTLYEGTMGIAIVLAQLYLLTDEMKYIKMLKRILKSSDKYDSNYRDEKELSAYNGCVSSAYCYYYIGEVLGEENLKKRAINLIISCEDIIINDSTYDIISGSAGALIVALRIYEKEHMNKLLDFAIKCGNHLLNHAINKDGIYGWHTLAENNMILAGMSHGNAGIAWALMELYGITKDKKYFDSATKAIEYENTLYNREDNNWTDMRNRENRIKKGFPEPVNWCHGAPGIGLSRIFCKKICDRYISNEEIRKAIEKTIKDGFGGSDCICHGSFGNLEILLEAANYYKNTDYLQYAQNIAFELINESKRNGWICGIPQKTLVPGFMAGLSGIAYGLLRVCDPVNVPNVLAFELP